MLLRFNIEFNDRNEWGKNINMFVEFILSPLEYKT